MTNVKAVLAVAGAAAVLWGSAAAAQVVHAVLGNGDLVRIDTGTGAGTLLGHSGVAVATGTSVSLQEGDSIGTVWTELFPFAIGSASPQAPLAWLSPCTGQQTVSDTWVVEPAGGQVRAAAGDLSAPGVVYTIVGVATGEVLERLTLARGGGNVLANIGPTGRGDLVAMAKSPAGGLYALGTENGGALYTVNSATGAALLVAPCAFGDARSLAFLPDGTLLAAGSNLERIDTATGAVTVIGPTGLGDVRALSVTSGCVPSPSNCYVNCDGSWNPPPILNVNDFICFQVRFTAGDPYANCDGSTVLPYLNVNDFICFQQRFAGACH